MAHTRFSEAQLQDILSKLKLTLHQKLRECKALTSNIGRLIKLAEIENTLKHPETLDAGNTVDQLNAYQRMLNEVQHFLKLLEEQPTGNTPSRGLGDRREFHTTHTLHSAAICS